jgi:hypothetical protein
MPNSGAKRLISSVLVYRLMMTPHSLVETSCLQYQLINNFLLRWTVLPIFIFTCTMGWPQLSLLLRSNKYPFFNFGIAYPGKPIYEVHKSSAISIHFPDEIFLWDQVWFTAEVNELLRALLKQCLWHFKWFCCKPLFLDVTIVSVPTIPLTQKATKFLCSQAVSQAREQWLTLP